MEAFAKSYVAQNPQALTLDGAHILAFSAVMLNTDLHNRSLKKSRSKTMRRMTEEEFINNNRGIDSGKDVPREVLERLYR